MPNLGGRYLWFKLALVVGSLLGLLLLVQSAVTYYQVSRRMVIDELWRDAQRQVDLIPREALQDPAKLQAELEDLRQAAPDKIAWIKLTESFPEAPQMGPPRRDVRSTPEGEVLVRVLPLGGRRGRGDPAFRGPMRTPPALPPARPTDRPPGQGFRPGPRVEIALYLSSARAVFGPLLTNLIVNSTAALGLVAAMILIWARFPHYVRGKQLEQQTELARKVQTDLLPSPTLALENLDFAAECVPAWQVGGDFYDVFNARDGRTAIVLGDVSGKGLPASVVAGLLLGAIRSSDWVDGSTQHETASQALSELLRTRTSVERFASLFWCYYEPATRSLRYVNAGHLPPMVVSKNGSGAAEVVRLEEGGPVLGVVAEASYRQGTAVVSDGAVLVLYSDGVVEATNAADEQYGEERLSAVIGENVHRPSVEIRDEILEQVHVFLGKERAQDDLTLVVARLQRQ